MRMPMSQRPEALRQAHHARHRVSLAERGAHVCVQRAARHPAQQPEASAVIEKVRAQSFGDRQHHVPMRHRGEQVLVEPQAPLGEPPRLARRAEPTPLAAERHQELRPARGAPNPCEPVLQEPAVEELPHHLGHHRAQRAVRRLVALFIYARQRLEVVGEHAVERRGLRVVTRRGR